MCQCFRPKSQLDDDLKVFGEERYSLCLRQDLCTDNTATCLHLRLSETGLELGDASPERLVLGLEFLQASVLACTTLASGQRVLQALALDSGDNVGRQVLRTSIHKSRGRVWSRILDRRRRCPTALGERSLGAGCLALARGRRREDRVARLDRSVEGQEVDLTEAGRRALGRRERRGHRTRGRSRSDRN